uniref:Uncharacterized protein n=1 Tax=Lessardia elongata TaxID=210733 RepID=A0A7S2QWB1_9DINO|mmetsp:Transcript_478/g.434  ORF Transcript_478/g.434 Transcript_478/m.434 type:complete len:117 (+) Transcript_478:1-351(+)
MNGFFFFFFFDVKTFLRPLLPKSYSHCHSLVVGVWTTLRATLDDTDKAAIVHHALLRTTSENLFLFSLCNLRSLVLDFARTRQTAVYLAHCSKLNPKAKVGVAALTCASLTCTART